MSASSAMLSEIPTVAIDLVEVIMALEQEFDLEIKDDEAENIRTVANAVNFIDEHQKA